MKNILSYFFYLIVFLQATHAASVEDLTYEVINDEVIITNCAESAEGSLEIPSEIDSKTVTSIGNYAFLYRSSLTSINIPDTVTNIGSYAFSSCSALTSINIPHGVTSIAGGTFLGCTPYIH